MSLTAHTTSAAGKLGAGFVEHLRAEANDVTLEDAVREGHDPDFRTRGLPWRGRVAAADDDEGGQERKHRARRLVGGRHMNGEI